MSKDQVLGFLKKNTMIIVLLIVLGFFSWQTGGAILLPMNVSNLISQNAYVFVLATGMLLCILTGGNIDLSVGSVVCFVGAVGAILMVNHNVPVPLAILIMILIGTTIGAFQGFWIAFVRIPPFIVTLAGMLAFRGLSNVVLNGLTVSIKDKTSFVNLFGGGADCYIPDLFGGASLNLTCLFGGIVAATILVILQVMGRIKKKSSGYDLEPVWTFALKVIVLAGVLVLFAYKLAQHKGIPSVLIWVLIVVLIYGYITSNTTVGRYFYAVGGNEKATKLSGIDPRKVYFWAYFLMSFLAGFSGLLVASRIGSVDGNMGNSYEMDAIASCFIGGASAYGGSGNVPGVMIGAILLGVINQGMSIYGLPDQWQYVVKGAVLLVAVIFDVVSKRKKG